LLIKFSEDKTEKKSLKVKVHPSGSVETDETGMERNMSEYSFRAGRIFRSAEILAIPCDENPVLFKQNLL
jgi:hypothetical protein